MAIWSPNWKKGKCRKARFEARQVQYRPRADNQVCIIVCNTDTPGGNGRPTGTVRA